MDHDAAHEQMEVEEDDEDHREGEDEDEDDDEDDEDEGVDEEEDDLEDGGQAEDDSIIEGGVAGGAADGDESRALASEADIMLYFLCSEHIKDHPDHPILQPGTKVRIGMGKNTRLSAVMQRYVEVCNQVNSDGIKDVNSPIEVSDLEFIHTAVLKGQDTAEQGALMKDDIVRVRQNRWEQHEKEREANRLQRESDLVYLEQMRQFMDKQSYGTAVLDCKGVPLENKSKHRVFHFSRKNTGTKVFCDAALVNGRCSWLGRKIQAAKDALLPPNPPAERSKSVVSLPDPSIEIDSANSLSNRGDGEAQPDQRSSRDREEPRIQDDGNLDDDEYDEHPIQMLNFDPRLANRNQVSRNAAAQIESDDESAGNAAETAHVDGMIHVVIPDHSPEAMKLLLEYCYTNRVICFGQEAFRTAARTKLASREGKGNVPPFGSKRWANRGEPTVSFEEATACIRLAEEASLARLSLMAEVAASHLISSANVIEALALCKDIENQYGNSLQRLRKVAMEVVFHCKPYGVYENIYKQDEFKDAVEEKAPLLVPALFRGTADAVEDCLGKKRYHVYCERDWKTSLFTGFRRYDQDDRLKRAQERSRNRKNREGTGSDDHPLIVDELDALSNDKASRKTMKRLRGRSARNSLRQSAEKRKRA